MSLFDPAAVSKQIDSVLSSIPPGQHVALVAHTDFKRSSVALSVRMGDHVGAFVRVSKTGGVVESDAGMRVSFAVQQPEEFTYDELVQVLKLRGRGWIKAHLDAFRLMNGKEVAL